MTELYTMPTIEVELDGSRLMRPMMGTLEEVVLRHELSQPSVCELCFVSAPRDFLPGVGTPVRIIVGHDHTELFRGEVAVVEYIRRPTGEHVLFVRSYDALQKLRRQHSLRTYTNVTTAGLAKELTSSLGITVSADDQSWEWRTLIQHNKSDFDFLREVAQRSGLFLTLRGSVLHLLALDGLEEQAEIQLGQTLFESSLEINGAFSSGPVTATAWNPLRAEYHQGQATSPRSNRKSPNVFKETGTVTLANQTAIDDRQAQALAQAELDSRNARSCVLSGTAEGNPALLPGTRIRVSGFPGEVPNQYVLASVIHRIGRRTGYVSEFSTKPPVREPAPEGAILALGTVCDIQDPDRLGRVRLSLPAVGGIQTDWLEVLAVGAGKGKGFVSLPDVGDKVVALFGREDMSTGVVVGGVFGADGVDDYGVDEKIVRFALLTPGGHKLHFDDTRRSLRMENISGSYVEFTPEKVTLHSTADLEISAPGKSMTIAANSIDFRRQ